MTITIPSDIRISVDGHVTHGTAQYARDKIHAVLRKAPAPVLSAHVRVTRHGDPAFERPVVAQANIDVNGRLIRAQARGDNSREAIDLLQARLRRGMERISRTGDRRSARRTAEAEDRPAERPDEYPWHSRPASERRIVIHKVVTLSGTIDDAATEMSLLDFDFYLFTESSTGLDSVLYRSGPTGLRLAQLTSRGPRKPVPSTIPVTISSQEAPRLTIDQAAARLGILQLPFLFFLDLEHQRGAVVYRRYDGHYGLITQAAE